MSRIPHAVLGALAAILLALGGLALNLLGAGAFGKPFAAACMMVLLAFLLGGLMSLDYLLGGCEILMLLVWAYIAWRAVERRTRVHVGAGLMCGYVIAESLLWSLGMHAVR